jgi:iron complex outermembrane receptor protein
VRLNADDLSGADLSSVSLSQVERIEVLRGAGAVSHGDGAVGGIVHIRTRRPRPGPLAGKLDLRSGAWGTREARLRATGGAGPLAASVTLSRQDSDGYRDNDRYAARDSAVELSLLPDGAWSFVDVSLRAARHIDEYGLPGPVSAEAFPGGSARRRASSASPLDGGSTDDRTLGARLRADFCDAGLLTVQLDHRDRENPYFIGVQAGTALADQRNVIDSTRRDLRVTHELSVDAFGQQHDLALGYVSQSSDYLRRENGNFVIGNSTRRSGELNGHAGWAEGVLRLGQGVSVNAGLRHDRAESRTAGSRYTRQCQYIFIPFPVEVPGSCVNAFRATEATASDWRNRASELGASWQLSPALTVFAADSRHFRNPNVDELALAAPDLRPQSGRTREAGLRARGEAVEFGATVYRMRIEDEIHFDSASGLSVNRNYDQPTVRTGVEVDLRWRVRPALLLVAHAGYVQPRFEGRDADVPLVPRRTASLRIEWTPADAQRITLSARHAGRRFDGNDLDNRSFAPLPSWTVFDLAVSTRTGAATWSAGINNLFDKVYSTLAYSNTYYPMPERTAWVAVNWTMQDARFFGPLSR